MDGYASRRGAHTSTYIYNLYYTYDGSVGIGFCWLIITHAYIYTMLYILFIVPIYHHYPQLLLQIDLVGAGGNSSRSAVGNSSQRMCSGDVSA